MKAERVLVVSHDAGGARALIPVAEELRRRGASVEAWVAGPSTAIWPKETTAVPCTEVPDSLELEDAVGRPELFGADVVLSAAGLYNEIEHTMRQAARRLGIRCVAVLDSWFNYGERFERWSNGVRSASRPDTICVMDEVSYQGMVAAGFAPGQLVVTGPPNLEASVRSCRSIGREQRDGWCAEQGLGAEDLVATFFSEPFATGPSGLQIAGPGALVGPDGRSLFGYDSVTTLETVLDLLANACERVHRRCGLVVRPHPMEWVEGLRSVVARVHSPWLKVRIHTDDKAAKWIAISDFVVGMMSVALLEAALAGKPALSVQIGLPATGQQDQCAANLLGYTSAIYDTPSLQEALAQVCSGNLERLAAGPRCTLQWDGAAGRVAAVALNR